MTAWACPNCGRRVPNHVETCRCGAAREHALAAAPPPPAPKKSGRGVLGLSTGVVGGILGFLLVKTVMTSGFSFFGSSVPLEELTSTASRINKMLPMMVDRHTELMTTIGMPNTFVYQYRIHNVSVDDLTPAKITELEQFQRKQILNLACTTPETRNNLLDRGVTLRYQYADANDRAFARVDIKTADCPAKR